MIKAVTFIIEVLKIFDFSLASIQSSNTSRPINNANLGPKLFCQWKIIAVIFSIIHLDMITK